jgi:hypothetical protein
MERHKEKYTEEMELKALEADPMNPELQKKIEERVSWHHLSSYYKFCCLYTGVVTLT